MSNFLTKRTLLEAIGLTVIALLLYLPNLSQQYDLDGVAEARALDGGSFFTPNHLTYRPAGYVVTDALNSLGYPVRSLTILRVLSSLFGAMAIGAAYVTFQLLGKRRLISAVTSLWLATTPAFWASSTDAGYILVAVFFVAVSIVCLLASRTRLSRVLCGTFAGLAILSWEANIFLLPGLLLFAWMLDVPRTGPGESLRAISLILIPCLVLTAFGYLEAASYTFGQIQLREMIDWVSGHNGATLPLWGKFEAQRISIWAGSFIDSMLTAHDEGFPIEPARIATTAAAALCLVLFAIRWKKNPEMRKQVLLLLFCFASFAPFLIWWDPWATKWFNILNLFLAGAFVRVFAEQRRLRNLLAVGLAAVVAINGVTVFGNEVGPRRLMNPRILFAQCIAQHMGEKDLFLATDWEWADYLPYFYQRKLLSFIGEYAAQGSKEQVLRTVNAAIRQTQSEDGDAYLLDFESFGPDRWQWLEAQTGITQHDLSGIGSTIAFDCGDEHIRKVVSRTAYVAGYVVVKAADESAVPATVARFSFRSDSGGTSELKTPISPPFTEGSLDLNKTAGDSVFAIAVVNPGETATTIRLTLIDSKVTAGHFLDIPLEPRQQFLHFGNDLFPDRPLNRFTGKILLKAQSPIALLSFLFKGNEFTVVPLTVKPFDRARPNGFLLLPHFAIGDGWKTQIELRNIAQTTADGQMEILDAAGRSMPMRLNGSFQTKFPYSIPPGNMYLLAPDGSER